MSEEIPESVNVRVKWPLGVGSDSRPVNQMVLQAGPPVGEGAPDGLWYLILGHVSPPVLLHPEDFNELQEVGESRVQVHAELAMTTGRLRELRDLIDRQLAAAETAQK